MEIPIGSKRVIENSWYSPTLNENLIYYDPKHDVRLTEYGCGVVATSYKPSKSVSYNNLRAYLSSTETSMLYTFDTIEDYLSFLSGYSVETSSITYENNNIARAEVGNDDIVVAFTKDVPYPRILSGGFSGFESRDEYRLVPLNQVCSGGGLNLGTDSLYDALTLLLEGYGSTTDVFMFNEFEYFAQFLEKVAKENKV